MLRRHNRAIYFKTTSWLTLSVIVTYIKKQLVIPQLL